MEPTKKKRGRPAAGKPVEKAAPSVKFTPEVDRLLTVQSKKLKVSKNKYADAAVAYFAENGLDPTKEQGLGFAGIAQKLDAVEAAIRKQNHEIGTRLVQIIRTWEKNSYAFMQNVQASTNNYLEMIESNLLQHQVEVEGKLLAPLVEGQFKGNLETEVVRTLVTVLYAMAPEPTDKNNENVSRQRAHYTAQRDKEFAKVLREFQETNAVPLPKPTRRPAVTPVPAAPPKPAPTVPTAPAKS